MADTTPREARTRSSFNPVYLGDIVEAGGPELAREVTETFISEAARRRTVLDSAVAAGDWTGAALAAHTIMSGATMLGLTAVAEAAQQIEYVTRELRPPSKASLLALDGALATARELLARAVAAQDQQRGAGR